jgi:hypothetical protein
MAARKSGGFITRASSRGIAYLRARLVKLLALPSRDHRERFFLLAAAGCLLIAIATLSAQTPPLKEFSHKKHLKLGNVAPVIAAAIDKGTYLGHGERIRPFLNSTNACYACHRGLEDSDRVSAANMPQMADCLVCHNTIEPPDSCAFCHPKDAQLKPVNHVAGFLDTHTNKNLNLDLKSCAVCHGKTFTCLGCHLK